MRNFLRASVIPVAVLGLAAAASAAGMADMVGTWKWTDYTIQCKEGGANGILRRDRRPEEQGHGDGAV